jgi:hypothetical protein
MRDLVLGALCNKTVVLVTHSVEAFSRVDKVLVLNGGGIEQFGGYPARYDVIAAYGVVQRCEWFFRLAVAGEYRTLLGEGTALQALLKAHTDSTDCLGQSMLARVPSSAPGNAAPTASGSKPAAFEGGELAADTAESLTSHSGQLVAVEEREVGRVAWAVYRTYVANAGWTAVPVLLLIQTTWQCLRIASDTWLERYTDGELPHISTRHFLAIYAALALSSGSTQLARTLIVCFSGLRTAHGYYNSMMTAREIPALTLWVGVCLIERFDTGLLRQNALRQDGTHYIDQRWVDRGTDNTSLPHRKDV